MAVHGLPQPHSRNLVDVLIDLESYDEVSKDSFVQDSSAHLIDVRMSKRGELETPIVDVLSSLKEGDSGTMIAPRFLLQ